MYQSTGLPKSSIHCGGDDVDIIDVTMVKKYRKTVASINLLFVLIFWSSLETSRQCVISIYFITTTTIVEVT
ncbi:hypothetical protein DERF_000809 [Dermatophagoides farinae]|uniref:Uncharacterized protein n=1 Tax=Dermatophagoides farinae TaxID=6954 RepID=A0A922I7C8_DERFA|nr:hypothetical protein DERF_000809 [Dermatophagoides farinae]